MKKELTVTVHNLSGEEGLSIACREGKLFRNDAQLEDLYKEGFRIYNYSIVEQKKTIPASQNNTLVRVFLIK